MNTLRTIYRFFFPDDSKLKLEAVTIAEEENGVVHVHKEFYTFRAFLAYLWHEVIKPRRFPHNVYYDPNAPVPMFGSVGWMLDPSRGALTFDAATTASSDGSGQTNQSLSHTATGSSRYALCIGATNDSVANISTATYGGVSMGVVTSAENGVGAGIKMYEQTAPATGAQTVQFNFSSTNRSRMVVVTFSGAHQTDASEATNTATGASTTPSVSVTTLTDGAIVVDGVIASTNGSLTVNGSQTEMANLGTANPKFGSSRESKATAGSVSMDWTISASVDWAMVAVAVKPVTSTAYSQTLSETATLTDSLVKQGRKVFSEVVTQTDSVMKSTAKAAFSETISLLDTLLKRAGKVFTETEASTDTLTRKPGKNLAETITNTDTVNKAVTKTALTETASLTDSLAKRLSRMASESFSLSDTFTTIRTYVRQLSEAVGLTDVLTRLTSKIQSESVTLTDTHRKSSAKTQSEAVTLSDTIAKQAAKPLSESVSLSDTLLRIGKKVLSEAVTAVDTFTSSFLGRTFYQVISETVSLADTLQKRTAKVFSESFRLLSWLGDWFRVNRSSDATYNQTSRSSDDSYNSFSRASDDDWTKLNREP